MVPWNEKDLALEEIVKEEEDFFEGLGFFFFIVSLTVLITVDYISTYDAVIEVKTVTSDVLS